MKMRDYEVSIEIGLTLDGENTTVYHNLMKSKSNLIGLNDGATITFAALRWMGFRVITCMNNSKNPIIWIHSWPELDGTQVCVARALDATMPLKRGTTEELAKTLIRSAIEAVDSQRKDPTRIKVHKAMEEFYARTPNLCTR